MKRWVFFKIFALVLALSVVLWMAHDLRTNGIDPAILGFEGSSNGVSTSQICTTPPVRVLVQKESTEVEAVLNGTVWVAKNIKPENMILVERGISGICRHAISKDVKIEGLKRLPKFEEKIFIELVNESTVHLKMTDAGLVQLNGKYYLNTDFIKAIDILVSKTNQ